MQIFSTKIYERSIRKLLSDDSRREMEAAIVADPAAAPAARDDLSPSDKRALTTLVAAIKEAEKAT